MQKLVEGIHQFQKSMGGHEDLFKRLTEGQSPLALFITCSDSRIVPNLLTQTDPGELFILRTAGNIVPPYGAVEGGEAATIEYAVSALKVQDVIVCGHSLCGAMTALLHPEQVQGLPAVASLLRHAEATRRIIQENYAHIEQPPARLMATIEENVLVQIENLKTHPCIAAALSRRSLRLHGWVYKLETGKVFAYSPEQQQFMSMTDLPQEALDVATSGWPSI